MLYSFAHRKSAVGFLVLVFSVLLRFMCRSLNTYSLNNKKGCVRSVFYREDLVIIVFCYLSGGIDCCAIILQ